MPVFQVGDLVRFRDPDDHEVGIILETRAMSFRQADAKVLWSDMPEPRWFIISDLVPVQPDGERGITG
jgi:hypothetical protein